MWNIPNTFQTVALLCSRPNSQTFMWLSRRGDILFQFTYIYYFIQNLLFGNKLRTRRERNSWLESLRWECLIFSDSLPCQNCGGVLGRGHAWQFHRYVAPHWVTIVMVIWECNICVRLGVWCHHHNLSYQINIKLCRPPVLRTAHLHQKESSWLVMMMMMFKFLNLFIMSISVSVRS